MAAAVLVVAAGFLGIAVVGGDSLAPYSPDPSGPAVWAFEPGLSAYDVAAGYDVWLLADGSTWTYAHGTWSNITVSAGIPTNMVGNSRLVYDARDQYVFLYGGEVMSKSSYGLITYRPISDSWTLVDGRWANITGSVENAPSPRILGPMAYDSTDQQVVLFGGRLVNATTYVPVRITNDTWTYAAGVWTNATVPVHPTAGSEEGLDPFYELVDDPADGYLLYYDALAHAPGASGAATWTYHDGLWTNRTAEFASTPDLFSYGGFAFDSTVQMVVAVAVCASTAGFACEHHWGVFAFAGGTWKDITSSSTPPGREYSGFADDPTDGGVVMVGGCCWSDFSGLSLGWQDAWVYAHGSWAESNPWGGSAPSWIQNDGTWAALSIAAGTGVAVAFVVRKPPPPSA